MLLLQAATVLSLMAKSRLQRLVLDVVKLTRAAVEAVEKEGGWQGRPVTGKMTSLLPARLGPSGGIAAGLVGSGGLGVVLPCVSAEHSRLLLEVFDDCSCVGRRLAS